MGFSTGIRPPALPFPLSKNQELSVSYTPCHMAIATDAWKGLVCRACKSVKLHSKAKGKACIPEAKYFTSASHLGCLRLVYALVPHDKAESKAALHDHAFQTGVKPQKPQQFVTAFALMSFLPGAFSKEMKSPYPRTPLQNRNHQDEGSAATQLPLRKEKRARTYVKPCVNAGKSEGLGKLLLTVFCPSKLRERFRRMAEEAE